MKTRKTFLLRISPRLYEELEGWAAQELRSVNAQIEYLLSRAVEQRRGRPLEPPPAETSPGQESPGGSES